MLGLCLILLVSVINPASASKYLETMQSNSGGFVSDRTSSNPALSEPTLRTTRTAIRAYRILGMEPPHRDRILSFLRASYDEKSGGFGSAPGKEPDPISTGVALMILGELMESQAPYLERALQFMNERTRGFEQVRMVASSLEELDRTVPAAEGWLRDLASQQNSDGSFGNGAGRVRATALSITAMQRLGGQPDATRTIEILRSGQRADGGFGGDSPGPSDLESCYRVVRLLRRLSATPRDVDGLKAYMAACRNEDGGYGRTPEEPSSLHGTYYVTIISHWLDGGEALVLRRWAFEDLAQGTLPRGWRIGKTLAEPGSRWEIVSSDKGLHGNVLRQTSSEGAKKQFNLCIGDGEYADLKLTVELRASSGVIDQGGGVIWRCSDEQNYYIARWNPLEQNLRMYKVVRGVRSQLDTAQANGDPAAYHTLSVVCVGRDMRAYFDGKLLLEAEDDEFPKPGRFGLWTKADAVTEFDNFSVRAAQESDIEEM